MYFISKRLYHLNHVVDVDRACSGVERAVLGEGGSEGGRGHDEEGEGQHLFIKEGVTRSQNFMSEK